MKMLDLDEIWLIWSDGWQLLGTVICLSDEPRVESLCGDFVWTIP